MRVMKELSLCRIEGREVGGKEIMEIRAHNLKHDFCVLGARKREGARYWHDAVVEGHKRRHKICGGNNGHAGWWSEDAADDSHTHTNLARHLVESGNENELKMLLLDYR